MAEVSTLGLGKGGYQITNRRFSDHFHQVPRQVDFILVSPDGSRKHVTMRREGTGQDDDRWRKVHSSDIRGFWGETATRAVRGAATGTAGYYGLPFYGSQWLAEKAVDWYGQAGVSAADAVGMYGPYPGASFFQDIDRVPGTEQQHDKMQRKRISAELLRMPPAQTPQGLHQYHPESVAGILSGRADPQGLTRQAEIDELRRRGATDEEIEQVRARGAGYSETNSGFEPGRTAPIPNRSALRSMDPMLSAVRGGVDRAGAPAGSLYQHSRPATKFFGGVESFAEMTAVKGAHSAARGATNMASRALGRGPGRALHPHSKEYIDQQARRMVQEIAEDGPLAKTAKFTGRHLMRMGMPMATFGGAMLVPEHEDGRRKTKEELFEEARAWALMTEFGRTGFMMGAAHLQPFNRLAQLSVMNWKRLAAKGNKKAMELAGMHEDVRSLEAFVRSRMGDKVWEDYERHALIAHNLGLTLKPITLMGKAGARAARTLVTNYPASAQKDLANAVIQATKDIKKQIDRYQNRLVSPQMRKDFPGTPTSAHPGTEKSRAAWNKLAASVDTSHSDRMKAWDTRYAEFLRDPKLTGRVDHTGLRTFGKDNTLRRPTDSDYDDVSPALINIQDKVMKRENRMVHQEAQRLVAEGAAENIEKALKMVNPEDLPVVTQRDVVAMIRSLRSAMRQSRPGSHAERSQLAHAVKRLEGMLEEVSPDMAAKMRALDTEYDKEIGQVFRSDFFKGRNMAENVSGSTRVGGTELHQAMMSDDLTVNRVVFEDLLRTGHQKELADAVVNTALTQIVGQAGDIDMRKLSNFITKNQEVLNVGTGAGMHVKRTLYEALEPQLRRSLGMRTVGFGTRVKRTVDYQKKGTGTVREEIIDDIPPDERVIDAALADRNVMKVLMEAVETGTAGGAAKAGAKPFRGVSDGRRMLQWAATFRLTQSKTPFQDMEKHRRSYELLFKDNPGALQTARDLARIKESIAHVENIEEITLTSKHSLTTGVGSLYSSFKMFVMANVGTSIGMILSNLKLISDARVRGPYFATGQAAEMVIGLGEVRRVLELLLDATGSGHKGTVLARQMMDRKLEAKHLTGRFGKLAANYFRPFFYEYEQGVHVPSERERETEAQSTNMQRLTQ